MPSGRPAVAAWLGSASRELPWYPSALMVAFVVNAFSDLAFHPAAATRSLVAALLAAVSLQVAGSLLLRDRLRGAFAATVVLGVLLGWPRSRDLVLRLIEQPLAFRIGIGLALLVLAAGTIWLFWRFVARPDGWRQVTYGLNVFTAMLLVVVAADGIRSGALPAAAADLVAPPPVAGRDASAVEGPDIYLVLLDGYERPDVLERHGLNDSAFVSALQARSFEVVPYGSSNYLITGYTLPSMFHMRHLVDIPELQAALTGQQPYDPSFRQVLNRNPVFDILHRHGYRIVTVPPPLEAATLRAADDYRASGGLTDFELGLMKRSAVADIQNGLDPDFPYAQERLHIDFAFSELARIAAERASQPRFALVHVMAPHMPAVFGPRGEPVRTPSQGTFWDDSYTDRGLSSAEFASAYWGQLLYVNERLLGAVDTIVAEDPDAVIVVFGDHGWGTLLDPAKPSEAALKERFAILLAARTPGRQEVFGPTTSLVNLFPLLFRAYLEESPPFSPDLRYIFGPNDYDLTLWEGTPGPG